MWKSIYTIISIMIIIPVLIVRSKIYEWFYNEVIRIVPEIIWKPVDLICIICIYALITIGIYQGIEEYKDNKKKEQDKTK